MKPWLLFCIVSISLATFTIPIFVNAQQPDNKTNAQQPDNKIYFQGNNAVVIRINNPYNGTQWEEVDNYTGKGYRIMSIIPSSSLYPDTKNPSLILVVMQKFS
jgi:hypothetical protein